MFAKSDVEFYKWLSYQATQDMINVNATMHYEKEVFSTTVDFRQTEWLVGEQGQYCSATGA